MAVPEVLNSILSDPYKFFLIAGSLIFASIIVIALLRVLIKITLIACAISCFIFVTKLPISDLSTNIGGLISGANLELSGFLNSVQSDFNNFSLGNTSHVINQNKRNSNPGRPNVVQISFLKHKNQGNLDQENLDDYLRF